MFAWDDKVYASQVFDGIVPVSAVLASRRWHPVFGGFAFNCTHAIVELVSEASFEAPQRYDGLGEDHYWLGFAGAWQQTPGPPLDDGDTSLRNLCEAPLEPALFDRLEAAWALPGGWWWQTDETIFVYSAPTRLAARFRYGD